jgi:hypothetical protein
MNDETPLTITVPEAGKKYFDLSVTLPTRPPNAATFQPSGLGAYCAFR